MKKELILLELDFHVYFVRKICTVLQLFIKFHFVFLDLIIKFNKAV